MMRNKLSLIVALFCFGLTINSNAQELNVIGSGGNYTDAGAYTVAWTIGEVITATASSTANNLTQGFHQGDVYVLSIEDYEQLNISVYPNPARDIINIVSDIPSEMSIYNAQGKLIDIFDITESTTTMDLSYLARGSYLLIFNANGSLAKKMKIVIL